MLEYNEREGGGREGGMGVGGGNWDVKLQRKGKMKWGIEDDIYGAQQKFCVRARVLIYFLFNNWWICCHLLINKYIIF